MAAFSAVCAPKPWLDAGERQAAGCTCGSGTAERGLFGAVVAAVADAVPRCGMAIRGQRERLAAPNYAIGAQNTASDGWIYRRGSPCRALYE